MVSIVIDDNLFMRSYMPNDAQELFSVINSSRQYLQPWLGWVGTTIKLEHSEQFIQQSLHKLHTQQALDLGIFHYNEIIGGIGMHHWDQGIKNAQVGYWIRPEFEGKGIINKCMSEFINYLFNKIGLNKIEIHFVPPNKRSARVAERLGFSIEGIIRQSVIRNGQPADIVITGLLKSEWNKW